MGLEFVTNPIDDRRWDEYIERNSQSTVFHSSAWLKALFDTYKYKPIVLTSSPPGETLRDGVVLSEVSSWVTGRRYVSVPFADHCAPLVDDLPSAEELFGQVARGAKGRVAYIELRHVPTGATPESCGWKPTQEFALHRIDLRPSLDHLFRNLHKQCIQRKIRKAEREELIYETGRSERLLQSFYALMSQTRRRHGVPPQPIEWFRNLIAAFGERLSIHLASQGEVPAAAILTLSFRKSVVYKYGCSDAALNHLGGTPFLFWNLIQESKMAGAEELDLGRSDLDNEGLITFKARLGGVQTNLRYWRYTPNKSFESSPVASRIKYAKSVVSRLPDPILRRLGEVIYRHVG